MSHFIFLYYIIAFCIGATGILISMLLYLKLKDKFIKDYLLFFFIFGIKIVEIIFMFYMFTNVNKNQKLLEISYTLCAITTFIFYTAMLNLINEVFNVPYKKIKSYMIFAVTLVLMFVGMLSYKIDIKEQIFYMSSSFYAVNIYCIGAVLYVIYNGVKYSENIDEPKYKKINSEVIKLFIICSPFTLIDSINLKGGKIIKLGEEFSIIYFLPAVYALFSLWFAYYLKKKEEEYEKNNEEIDDKIFFKYCKIENIEDEILEKYKISIREKEVLLNLLNGNRNQEIADIMKISINTVKSHLNNIYSKMGVRKREEIFNLIKLKK